MGILVIILITFQQESRKDFDATRAYEHVISQTAFGPRVPGSQAHAQTITYIKKQLDDAGWIVEFQEFESLGHPGQNLVAKRGSGSEWVILGAHYDSRIYADRDSNIENQLKAVPGANDGASGVAVLLELARVLPAKPEKEIWLVFFDLEDQGRIEGWDWILGSKVFVENLQETPDAVIVIDMIGDTDLNLYREKSSNPELVTEIWQLAADLGYGEYFIDTEKYAILDDHTPFLASGMKAIDIIDFDNSNWHTTEDTVDKVSPQSLKVVGDVLLAWLTR